MYILTSNKKRGEIEKTHFVTFTWPSGLKKRMKRRQL